jgi:hypothetical protein
MSMTLARIAYAAAASGILLTSSLAHAGTDVGVSVSINQPGFYGRVDVGNAPQPTVIYSQPVVIVPGPVAVHQRPIYLRVPPGHEQHWDKHCYEYRACGQPVYFVREVHEREDHDYDRHHHGRKHDRHEHDHDDDDRGGDHDHGHGHGH